MKKLNALSLFNGMSVLAMALEDAGIKVNNMYISEIDKCANRASEVLFPNQIQLGSVCDWESWDIDWSSIDLVTGGFPCQAWSMAGKQLGDKDERGMLFWTMLDIMKKVREHNPKAHFLIENVKMKKEFEQYITHHTEQALGEAHKALINSALVSAQNRNRYYWTSFPVTQPEDCGIVIADILDKNPAPPKVIKVNDNKRVQGVTENDRGYRPHKGDKSKSGLSELGRILKTSAEKSDTVTASHSPKIAINGGILNLICREASAFEVARLQTIPVARVQALKNSGISERQIKKLFGNGWTMKIISHILGFMPEDEDQC